MKKENSLDKVKQVLDRDGEVVKDINSVDTFFEHTEVYESEDKTTIVFSYQKKNLLYISLWSQLSGNATFIHYDQQAQKVERQAEVGDFVAIDLPGPLPLFWVHVTEIINNINEVKVKVQPTYDPTAQPVQKDITAHFFTREAENILTIGRNGNKISAKVIGLCEVVNNEKPEAGDSRLLHTSVALAGRAGLQKQQWEAFVKNLATMPS